jgi:2-dehydropantoate 2-reductase
MRVAIIGSGAIGCLLAARLSGGDAEVTLVARRASVVSEIRRDGILMVSPQGRLSRHRVAVTDDPLAAGPQDVVIVCVKAYALQGILDALGALSTADTLVVPMVNGIPWWYPYGLSGPLDGYRLRSLDPDGVLGRSIDPRRVLGAVVYVAVENDGAGRIRHIGDQAFVLGDPAGRMTAGLEAVSDLLTAGGFQPKKTDDIRAHVWTKLWGNVAFNPLSVLTGATLGALCLDAGTRAAGVAIMEEARQVAERLGVVFPMTIDERIASSALIGNFKTSMLQDFETGRRLELEAIVDAVVELAGVVGVATPILRTVGALTAMRARNRESTV